jgi:hypothetical protein
MSKESRALLEWLALQRGMRPAAYMRQVWEDHLEAEGFPRDPGGTTVTDPLRDTPDGWRRDHSEVLTDDDDV